MGRPGGTEAPLFGAQASLGKGRVYNQGRKGGLCRGRQLAGLFLWTLDGGQVPSTMPPGGVDRGSSVWRGAGTEWGGRTQRGVSGQGGSSHPTPTPPPREDEQPKGPKSSSSRFQSFLGTEAAWGGSKLGGGGGGGGAVGTVKSGVHGCLYY